MRVSGRKTRIPSCAVPQATDRQSSDSIYDSEFIRLDPGRCNPRYGLVNCIVIDPNNSSGEVAPDSYSEELLRRDETCPLCGKDNQCRIAKGHLYKGLCWCDQIVVPGHILSRLAAEWVEPACLCYSCLETIARVSASLNDPDAVLTEVFPLTRSSGSMPCPVALRG
jgi:hypothetical protein